MSDVQQDYDPFLTWEDLKEKYNLPYTRQNVLGKGRMVSQGLFPAPIRLGNGLKSRLAWRRSRIEAWIENLPVYVPPMEDDDTAPIE